MFTAIHHICFVCCKRKDRSLSTLSLKPHRILVCINWFRFFDDGERKDRDRMSWHPSYTDTTTTLNTPSLPILTIRKQNQSPVGETRPVFVLFAVPTSICGSDSTYSRTISTLPLPLIFFSSLLLILFQGTHSIQMSITKTPRQQTHQSQISNQFKHTQKRNSQKESHGTTNGAQQLSKGCSLVFRK